MSYRNDNRHDRGELPKLYDVFRGEIVSLQQYGIFVKIPGSRKNGLVHKSQMSNSKVEHPDEMVGIGESVYCKVISIDDEDKIGLSMKTINQSTGKDMDPTHVQSSLDEQRRKTGHVREIKGIHLGAVYDTTCKKCGGKGHMAKDCFHVPGETKYDLLPAVDHTPEPETKVADKSKKKHKKEKKKRSKKQKRKHCDSDSDSESEKDKEKKHKKKEKRKREHRSSQSTDSDSDSGDNKRRRSSNSERERHNSGPKSMSKSVDSHFEKQRSHSWERKSSQRVDNEKEKWHDRNNESSSYNKSRTDNRPGGWRDSQESRRGYQASNPTYHRSHHK